MFGYLIALLWGFAEATLFFIIPDVWISILALQSRDEALLACLYSVAGAMIGGTIMYYLGRADAQKWNMILDRIPAIRIQDIEKVRSDLNRSGVIAVLLGPLFGIPYKLYAVNAHAVMGVSPFLLISIPARGIRFILIALVTDFVSRTWLGESSESGRIGTILAFWAITYAVYFFIKRR